MTTDHIEALAKVYIWHFPILTEIGSFNYWPNSGGICYSKLHMTSQDVTHLSKATRRLLIKQCYIKALQISLYRSENALLNLLSAKFTRLSASLQPVSSIITHNGSQAHILAGRHPDPIFHLLLQLSYQRHLYPAKLARSQATHQPQNTRRQPGSCQSEPPPGCPTIGLQPNPPPPLRHGAVAGDKRRSRRGCIVARGWVGRTGDVYCAGAFDGRDGSRGPSILNAIQMLCLRLLMRCENNVCAWSMSSSRN